MGTAVLSRHQRTLRSPYPLLEAFDECTGSPVRCGPRWTAILERSGESNPLVKPRRFVLVQYGCDELTPRVPSK
jgi:hypothetical protein